MKRIMILFVIVFIIFSYSCKKSEPTTPEPTNTPNLTQTVEAQETQTQAIIETMTATWWTPTNTPTITPTLTPVGGGEGKIVFYSKRDGNGEIYVMNSDGSNQINLTNSTGVDGMPDWSPDGTQIAFSSNRDGDEEVYVMNADGSNQINLTNNANGDNHPSWSPDGTQIVFSTNRNYWPNIYTMDSTGSNITQLTNGNDYSPAWSFDGTKITFWSPERQIIPGIQLMNSDGSSLHYFAGNKDPGSSAWSPDSTIIVYSAKINGYTEIYIKKIGDSFSTRITYNTATDGLPCWK